MPLKKTIIDELAKKYGYQSASNNNPSIISYEKDSTKLRIYYTSAKKTVAIVRTQQRFVYHTTKRELDAIFRKPLTAYENAHASYKAFSSRHSKRNTNVNASSNSSKQGKTNGKPIKYGKAGTRTEHQKKLVKESFDELFASFGDNEIICFTDGACKGNPGPAGSGMVVLFGKKNGNTIEKSLALGKYTNNISELYAIGLSVHIVQHHPSSDAWIRNLRAMNDDKPLMIRILSDSRYSIGVLSEGWKAKKNVQLIDWIRREVSKLSGDKFVVTFHWVGGHSGIEYNERADQLANQGVEGAKKGRHVDVTKPPDLYQNRSNSNASVKRGRKRKLNELSDLAEINNGKRVKRRRLKRKLNALSD
eukprot:17453_1